MAFLSLTDGYLTSTRVERCFDAAASVRRMLEFEAALARAEAELGLVPQTAATVIADVAGSTVIDLDALTRATADSSNPAVPLVQQLTAAVAARDSAAAHFVHWGSTSQDVVDSAAMVCCRAALVVIDGNLNALRKRLSELIERHYGTLLVVRTLSQHATPTTFACKSAGWLQGLLPGQQRLRELHGRLPLQFGGAGGTRAAFGADAAALAALVAARLGLVEAPPWHTERSIVRELAGALGDVAAAAGKIAGDLLLMMQTEVDELREAPAGGRGGSSALPHKRNPVSTIGALAAARRASGFAGAIFAGFDHAHERACGAWQAEQRNLADLFIAAAAALEQLDAAFDGLEVRTARMQRNLDMTGGLVLSEAVVMALAPAVGRPAAQALVKRCAAVAETQGQPLEAALAAEPAVTAHLSAAAIKRVLDPANNLGQARVIAESVAAAAAALDDGALT